jgi:membrane-associated phospholipid phosphatase
MGLSAATWLVPQLFIGDLVSASCPCDRVDLPAIDRVALDRSSSRIALGSHVLVAAMLVAPVALDVIDVRRAGGDWRVAGEDLVIMGEAVLVDGALDEVVKLAVQRPRPRVYTNLPGELAKPDNYLSFYSGHTSTAFAAGMSYATTFALRHPDSPWRWVIYGGAAVAGSAVGSLRVLAGRHFTTDVLAGALAGTVVGLAVPRLHRRRALSVAVGPGGFAVQGAF